MSPSETRVFSNNLAIEQGHHLAMVSWETTPLWWYLYPLCSLEPSKYIKGVTTIHLMQSQVNDLLHVCFFNLFWHDIQHLFLCLKSTWLWYTLKFDGWNLILPFLLVASVGVNPHVQALHPYIFFMLVKYVSLNIPKITMTFPYKFWYDILIYSWFPEENPHQSPFSQAISTAIYPR